MPDSEDKAKSKNFEKIGKEALGDTEDLEHEVEKEIKERVDERLEKELEKFKEEQEKQKPLSEREDLDSEEAEELREQKISRLMQVLNRGILNDRLQRIVERCVPPNYRSKFVRDNEGDVVRYENLGYGFEYAEDAEGVHGTGDGRVRVGDVVLMTISEEDYRILQEVRRRQIRNKLGDARREYLDRVAAASGREEAAPAFDESKTTIGARSG